jgi:hypothetical protein
MAETRSSLILRLILFEVIVKKVALKTEVSV